MVMVMTTLNVSKAKAQFSSVMRRVIRTKQPILISTPHGYVQIVPYDLPDYVPPAPPGALGSYTKEELDLSNNCGEVFGA